MREDVWLERAARRAESPAAGGVLVAGVRVRGRVGRMGEIMAMECPHCGYDLRGLPAGRCPECGFGYDHAGLRALKLEARRHREANDGEITGLALLVGALLIFTGEAAADLVHLLFLPKALMLGCALVVADLFDPAEPPRSWWLLPVYASGVAGCITAAMLLLALPVLAKMLGGVVAVRMVAVAGRQPGRATHEPDHPVDSGPEARRAYGLLSTRTRICYFVALAWAVLTWIPGACV